MAGVADVLGPGGMLEQVLEGYEHRPQQLRVAQEVERALAQGEFLLAEAGTGTGKTLAYLVPALQSGKKVLVSTATKTLQDQIFSKDLTQLRRLGLRGSVALLKGRANYLCLHKLDRFDGPELTRIREWAEQTSSGDLAELPDAEGFNRWTEISTTSDACLGTQCPAHASCFVTRARERAARAQVTVVNHHLFFADLALRRRGVRGKEGLLPECEVAVFDEAHALESIATEFFGRQLSDRRLDELCQDALEAPLEDAEKKGMVGALALKVRGAGNAFFAALTQSLQLPPGQVSARVQQPDLAQVAWEADELAASLAALLAALGDAPEPELAALARRAAEAGEDLEFLVSAKGEAMVRWLESRKRSRALRASPVDVSGELSTALPDAFSAAVFTSATLTTEGDFAYFAKRVGLVPGQRYGATQVRALRVDSPFDYASQAALYLPRDLPEPHLPQFVEAVADEIVRLCERTGGRAFALFTSLKAMERAHALARERLPFQVLLQGEGPKTALLEQFRQRPSVLFASHSFWEGVDVPGDALSLVVIDKLPFASPGDPLVAARIEAMRQRGEEPFSSYQLPEAVLALRQAFGRLVRTQHDRGVVALLDRRLESKRYGRTFLQSLPKASRLFSLAEVERWLAGDVRRVG